MTKINLKFFVFLFAVIFSISTLQASTQGKVTGASMHKVPDWFKESFLEIDEDIAEAKENGKHIILFLDLQGCPYCTKMLDTSFFANNDTSKFIQKHFDVININIKGSREITWSEDEVFTEKELAQKLNVQYSPTVLFLDYDKNVVVRLNGYRSPKNFKNILEYVNGKHYKNMKVSEYLDKVKDKSIYRLKDNKMFKKRADLSGIKTPLAVIFEDGSCTQCGYFHNTTLKNKDVQNEFAKYTVVRLDANSESKITTPDGKTTTPKAWANSINLEYRPGILLYNEGKLQQTVDALLYSFHFKELLKYISEKHYTKYDGYLSYLKDRQTKLKNSGVNIDISDKH
jgi:thioredoxin-related protein